MPKRAGEPRQAGEGDRVRHESDVRGSGVLVDRERRGNERTHDLGGQRPV